MSTLTHLTTSSVFWSYMKAALILFLAVLSMTACCPHRFHPAECPDPLPSFCIPERIRVALVLGSGGIRGAAHIGVLEVLEEAGIPIDLIVGCSAGSIVGALYADHPHIGEIKTTVWGIRTNSMLDIDIKNCRFGLSQDVHMRRALDRCLHSESFEDLHIPLVIVASDLHSGELVPIGSGPVAQAVQASCSIPFVFVPCEYRGRVLVDGGVVNPVPVCVARDLGAEVIIAVDLCELLPRTFPTNLFGVMQRSAEIAFMWQNDCCTRSADIIIRPKTCGVGCFDETKKRELYEAGRVAAEQQVPLILKLVCPLMQEPYSCARTRLIEPCPYRPGIEEDFCEVP